MRRALRIPGRLGQGDQPLGIEIRVNQRHGIFRSLAGAVKGEPVQLLAGIKAEEGLEGRESGLRFRLLHLGQQTLAQGGGAQGVAINMGHPGRFRRHIGPQQGRGDGAQAEDQECARTERPRPKGWFQFHVATVE